MAELFKRARSPFWYAYLSDPRCPDGLRKVSTKRRSKTEAREIASALQGEIDAEIVAKPLPTGGLTWTEAVLIHDELATLKPSTRASNGYLAQVVARDLGDFELMQLDHETLRRFCQERRKQLVQPPGAKVTDKRVTDATIRRALSYISAVYATLIDHDVEHAPSSNPLKTFDRGFLKNSKRMDRHLRPAQFVDALESCKTPHHRAMLIVLVGTGMRENEVCQLRWIEIDFENSVIEFGNLDGDRTKSSRSRRIPLLGPVADALREHRRSLAAHKRYHPRGLVFPNPRSKVDEQIARKDFAHLRKAVQVRTGMKRFTIHGLRHTFASWALQQGADQEAIRKVLGHVTLSTTSLYAHHVEDSELAQLRKLDLRLPAHFTAHTSGLIGDRDNDER